MYFFNISYNSSHGDLHMGHAMSRSRKLQMKALLCDATWWSVLQFSKGPLQQAFTSEISTIQCL
jgi:hypothetical protein